MLRFAVAESLHQPLAGPPPFDKGGLGGGAPQGGGGSNVALSVAESLHCASCGSAREALRRIFVFFYFCFAVWCCKMFFYAVIDSKVRFMGRLML